MVDIESLNSLDEALFQSAKSVKPLYYLEPVNMAYQKERFLGSSTNNPSFSYRSLEYDPGGVVKSLASIEIPDGELGQIFKKQKKNTLLENRIITNLGDSEIVMESSISEYGLPSEQLVRSAEELLNE